MSPTADNRPFLYVSNFDSQPCTLTVEPWGREFILQPDEQVVIHTEALLTGDVEVTHWSDGIQVCISNGELPRIFSKDGTELLLLGGGGGHNQMNPAEIVRAFVNLTSDCLDLMRATYGSFDKPSLYRSAEFTPRDGSAPQTVGRIGTNATFRVHGIGCRFELDSGEIVDVDWDQDGRAIFDSWRLVNFAESIGVAAADRALLRAAAVADPELRQVKDGWFSWADSRHDLGRGDPKPGTHER